jgi:hypothetical protein
MKKLISIFILISLCSAAMAAQTYFANTNSKAIKTSLPTTLVNADGSITYQPTTNMLRQVGWRLVTSVESPAAGWAVDSYNVVEGTLGRCSLTIATQHNISAAADAAVTNNPLWTVSLVANAQTYRAILDTYFSEKYGPGVATNFNVTPAMVTKFFSDYSKTNTLTQSNLFDLQLAGRIADDLRDFSGSTVGFPWRLVP